MIATCWAEAGNRSERQQDTSEKQFHHFFGSPIVTPVFLLFRAKQKGHGLSPCPFLDALVLVKLRPLRTWRPGQGCLGLDGEGGEAGGVVGGDVGEDLAIEAVAGQLEAVDEGRVAHAVQLAGGVDADDPEGAELALLLLAAGVGEHESALDGLLGCLIELGFGEEVTTRALEDLFAAVVAFCTPFYTGHRASPFAYIV